MKAVVSPSHPTKKVMLIVQFVQAAQKYTDKGKNESRVDIGHPGVKNAHLVLADFSGLLDLIDINLGKVLAR